MKSTRSNIAMLAAVGATSLLLAGCTGSGLVDRGSAHSGSDSSTPVENMSKADSLGVTQADLLKRLDSLQISESAKMSGYDRDRFPHWEQASPEYGWSSDVSACSARWATLWYAGTNLTWENQSNCEMIIGDGGGWTDRYGKLTDRSNPDSVKYFSTDDPSKIDIDHIVSLGDAWRSGASGWADDDSRSHLANDSLNLAASDPSANRSKGDLGPADYLPPGEFRCEYAQRYALVKSKYNLVVTQADKDTLRFEIEQCG